MPLFFRAPHDYKRNGTATLFAALNTRSGEVMGTCMQKTHAPGMVALLETNPFGNATEQTSAYYLRQLR